MNIFIKISAIAFIFFFLKCSHSEVVLKDEDEPLPDGLIDSILITKWLNGMDYAISFTWDDGNEMHWKTVGPLFESYGYHATFFVQTNLMWDRRWDKFYIDGYKRVVSNGHEVGSHTFEHINLSDLNTPAEIERQLTISKNDIKRFLDYNAISFCHPFNRYELRIDTLVTKFYLNSRYSSVRNTTRRIVYAVMAASKSKTLQQQFDELKNSPDKDWLIYAGHGVDGAGYSPMSSYELDKYLAWLKNDTKDRIWVTTFGEAAIYECLSGGTVLIHDKENSKVTLDYSKADEQLNKYQISSRILSVRFIRGKKLHYKGEGVIGIDVIGNDAVVTIDLEKSNEIIYY